MKETSTDFSKKGLSAEERGEESKKLNRLCTLALIPSPLKSIIGFSDLHQKNVLGESVQIMKRGWFYHSSTGSNFVSFLYFSGRQYAKNALRASFNASSAVLEILILV